MTASEPPIERTPRMLVGVTGGVAAYKAAHLVRALTTAGAEVTVIMTESATRFVGPDTFASLTGRRVYVSLWDRPGEVLHVRLASETDLAIVAPATANVLAKLALGLADDLLSATLLEYSGPLVIAPAMHTGMWEHTATQGNVETLEARGATFVGPVDGPLAHGDSGVGRFADPDAIAAEALAVLDGAGSLEGRTIVVTAGPTFEAIDPVRFIGNHSSGTMGIAAASEAVRRGARVQLILGPGTVPPPAGIEVVRVTTAEQMREAVMARIDGADAVVMAAAVADFRPKDAAEGKIKKDDGVPEIVLEPTPDILAELGERTARPYLIGFAAETSDVEAHGRAKLARKHLDLLIANEVGREGTGFGSQTNHAAILSANGDDVQIRDWTKRELARAIVDRIEVVLDSVDRP